MSSGILANQAEHLFDLVDADPPRLRTRRTTVRYDVPSFEKSLFLNLCSVGRFQYSDVVQQAQLVRVSFIDSSCSDNYLFVLQDRFLIDTKFGEVMSLEFTATWYNAFMKKYELPIANVASPNESNPQ